MPANAHALACGVRRLGCGRLRFRKAGQLKPFGFIQLIQKPDVLEVSLAQRFLRNVLGPYGAFDFEFVPKKEAFNANCKAS